VVATDRDLDREIEAVVIDGTVHIHGRGHVQEIEVVVARIHAHTAVNYIGNPKQGKSKKTSKLLSVILI